MKRVYAGVKRIRTNPFKEGPWYARTKMRANVWTYSSRCVLWEVHEARDVENESKVEGTRWKV